MRLTLFAYMIWAKKKSMHPISELLCDAYEELHRQGQVSFPLHDTHRAAIDSIVKTVNSRFFGIDRFPTPEDRAVAYLCLIIKGHPVTDGNKRLGLLWFRIYCVVNKLNADPAPFTLDEIAVSIETDKDARMDELMEIVKKFLFRKPE